MSTLSTLFVPLAEAGGEESGLPMAIGIGLGVLALLLLMVLGLMAFGKGRDHS